MGGATWQALSAKLRPPRASGLEFSGFANDCKTIEIGSEASGLELAVTGAIALVAAACGWWIQDDEANCSGRLGRQFMKRKFFGAAAIFKNPISAAARNERRGAAMLRQKFHFLRTTTNPGLRPCCSQSPFQASHSLSRARNTLFRARNTLFRARISLSRARVFLSRAPRGISRPKKLNPNAPSGITRLEIDNMSPGSGVQTPGSGYFCSGAHIWKPGSNGRKPGTCFLEPGIEVWRPGESILRPISSCGRPFSSIRRPFSSIRRPFSSIRRPFSSIRRALFIHQEALFIHQEALFIVQEAPKAPQLLFPGPSGWPESPARPAFACRSPKRSHPPGCAGPKQHSMTA